MLKTFVFIALAMIALAMGAFPGIGHPVFAQEPDTLWTKTFGGEQQEIAHSVSETSDGGFVIAGQTFSFAAEGLDAWVIRTDADGDTLWTKTYEAGGDIHENAQTIEETSDGGFIMAGSSYGAVFNGMLIRTDEDGDALWTRIFGGFDTDMGYDVLQTPDGGFVLCGMTRSYHNGFGSSVWLMGIDANGDSLWTKTYGGSSYQGGYAIAPTSDEGLIVAGSYNGGGPLSEDVWLLRTDAVGDTLWTSRFEGVGTQQGSDVLQTADGGYAVLALSFAAASEVWLIRTDADGDSLWSRTFEGQIADPGSLDETSDGGFIISGVTENGDVLLIRTDENGDQLWTQSFGGDDADLGKAVRQTADGGYIVVGDTDSYGAGQSDVWMIRLGPETTTSDSEDASPPPHTFRLHQNFPNPFNPSTTITYSVQRPTGVHLTIFNMLGQEVRTLVSAMQPAGEYSITWDGRDAAGATVSSGPYLYRMRVDNVVQTRSMLFLK